MDTRVPLARAACAHVTLLGLKPVEIKTLESLTSPCLSEATLPWRAQSFVSSDVSDSSLCNSTARAFARGWLAGLQ